MYTSFCFLGGFSSFWFLVFLVHVHVYFLSSSSARLHTSSHTRLPQLHTYTYTHHLVLYSRLQTDIQLHYIALSMRFKYVRRGFILFFRVDRFFVYI
ncbi:hypothetical protein C8R44DRAFT_184080 [Mycena epipterygia]|nr:hypothetical protein C8R44DRAFT_184080 [Mycena epipterygia]